jgi:hypothetical protein
MNQKTIQAIALATLTLVAVLCAARPGRAQDAKNPYPKMAPLEQYLMDRDGEIALARSAAPVAISGDADVVVLGRNGYETAIKGKNGFVCIVERSWTSAPSLDFWNPKVRTPMCFNAAGARSYLPRTIKRTDLALAGRTEAQADEIIAAAVDKKELPAMETGAMCYMMSKQGYGGDSVEHWHPHLMFYDLQIDPATLGADLPNSPIQAYKATREHFTTIVFLVRQWSDGTQDLGHHD